ncbi:rRNA (guanine-N1)-methyltransferase [Corallincola holothuriorum]|uniref:rRNA (Guanine-N1)-methyltransferase n=1 Tax=Corallincola holothuriorum TaxID=2282215 RepID=A0A368N5D1_9GAMM|nr:PilC/PilY family type IV pilus protein [Corallincola holothuriorum]RCU45752.1 rRNA (guanine-N1)-methyltransferase [Corallincola holothuriorum]
MKIKQLGILLGSALTIATSVAVADDTELFLKEVSARTGYKPKVMIIFDNSGSMRGTIEVKQAYDPSSTYSTEGSDHSLRFDEDDFKNDFIYWVKGSLDGGQAPVPGGPADQSRFNFDIFNCNQAEISLRTKGYFTGYIRQYTFSGNSGSWEELKENNSADTKFPIDCLEDILMSDNANNGKLGYEQGYPVNGQGSKKSPDYYSDFRDENAISGGEPVTLYMANYLKWYHNEDIQKENRTKLAIAKESINDVISSTLIADFGLTIFNRNYSTPQGGRIVKGIPENMTEAQRSTLTDTIEDLDANTNTPLCETMYEVKRYFGGEKVVYSDVPSNQKKQPYADTSIWNGGNYTAPFGNCDGSVSVILVTDGLPTEDNHANSLVTNLPYAKSTDPRFSAVERSYLPVLTGWMNTQDINTAASGKQTASVYTVGFGDVFEDADSKGVKILSAAAENGGGDYYTAQDAIQLTAALQDAIMKILQVNASLTSPAVATNSFDRTEVLDVLYYSIFKPSQSARWLGNLKKLKLNADGTQVIDANEELALSNSGGILKEASSYWGGDKDGPDASKGGVVQMLEGKSDRTILTDIGGADLIEFTAANVLANASAAQLALIGADNDEVTENINWMRGLDVNDEEPNSDRHLYQFGDPMHSRPVVINYGGDKPGTQDLRILIGTNYGFVHLFKDLGDDEVDEDWAFAPSELIGNYKPLRHNSRSSGKIYGMDGTASVYIEDTDLDGLIDSGEKVWAFIGMRRGGHFYYALDLTVPSSPKKMWQIEGGEGDFVELAQTWSKPTITYLRSHGADKPVLVFGAGYDINKDNPGVGTDDNVGRGVFLVDAETGHLIWKFTSSETGGKNTQISGLADSIPSDLSVMDSDYDGFADRIYASDTGGNIWRIDMPGDSLADAGAFKFATLSGDLSTNDRRFFVRPVVARSLSGKVIETTDAENNKIYSEAQIPVDYVTIGSGNVSHPLDVTTQDMFFMLRDLDVLPLSKNDAAKKVPLTISDLFDLKDGNLEAEAADDSALLELRADADAKRGCFIDYPSQGEKVLSSARIISGVVFHSGFTPAGDSTDSQCEPSLGANVLYADSLCDITEAGVAFPATNLPPYNPPPIFIQDGAVKLITAGGVEPVPELPQVPKEDPPTCEVDCPCDPAVQNCSGEPQDLPFDAVIKAQSAYREGVE